MLNLLGCSKESFVKVIKLMGYKVFEDKNEMFFLFASRRRHGLALLFLLLTLEQIADRFERHALGLRHDPIQNRVLYDEGESLRRQGNH